MRPMLVSVLSTVQLTRLANAFAGVANLWFVVLWTRAVPVEHGEGPIRDMSLWLLLGLSAVLGVGLSAYAGALNDVFDVKRDQALAPHRPVAAGRISMQTAAVIGFGSLIAAMLAATVLGTTALLMCLLCAIMILFFQTTSRHLPAAGLTSVAAIFVTHMLIVNLGLRFIWPIMLIMVHATAVHAAVYAMEDKRPRYTSLTAVGTVLGLAVLVLLLWYQAGDEGLLWETAEFPWYGLLWPAAAIMLFIISSTNKVRFASSRAFAAEKLQRYGSLWMGLYAVAWLLGRGLYWEAAILCALVSAGVVWMLLVRDLGAWIEQPVGYRW